MEAPSPRSPPPTSPGLILQPQLGRAQPRGSKMGLSEALPVQVGTDLGPCPGPSPHPSFPFPCDRHPETSSTGSYGGPFPLFFTFFLRGLWTSVPLQSSTFEDRAEQKHSLPSPASRMVTPEGSGSYFRVRSPAAFCFPEEGRGPRQTDHRGKLTTRHPGLAVTTPQALTSAFSWCWP